MLGAPGLLNRLDDLLDVLGAILGGDENAVVGRDDDEVVDAQRRDQVAVGADVAVGGVERERIAHDHVAVAIVGADVPQRRP